MSHYKKELCRNFQRGSCQYGERCRYLHATQQHPKPNNLFGFGNQQQQHHHHQKPNNSFGFGPQSKGATNDFGNKPSHQFKPFENKWTRFSPIANAAGAAPSSRQPDNQPQPVNHKCTDPESCKRLIAEDFEHERPLWKLTCYGHLKNGPCDIIGDVSYEELQAAAYDDAKRGLSLQSIVERERNLLNSKLIEFENLLRNPYTVPSKSALSGQSPFPGATPNAISAAGQNSAPPSVSSFSQLGASLNMGSQTSPSAPSSNALGQQNLFSNSIQTSSAFGARPSAPSNNAFGQSNLFSTSGQPSSAFGANNFPSSNAGSFGSQNPNWAFGSSFSSHTAGFGNGDVISAQSNSFPSSALSTQKLHSSSVQPPIISSGSSPAPNAVGQATTNTQSINNVQRDTVSGDSSIWFKEKWTPGEIPEEAPPDEFIY